MAPKYGVTGARGVLGSRIVTALEDRGIEVNGFVGDVRDRTVTHDWVESGGFDAIVHSAAIVPVHLVEADPASAIAINVGGSANVASAAHRHGARLIYVSSSHVYTPQEAPIDEDGGNSPPSLYGLTKLQGEEWCRRLVEDHLIARVFSFFDERQSDSFVVGGLRKRVSESPSGGELSVRGWGSVRDFASAEWVADVIASLAVQDSRGVVNVGTGIGTSIGALARMVVSEMGRHDLRVVADGQADGNWLVADTTKLDALLPGRHDFDLIAALGSRYGAL